MGWLATEKAPEKWSPAYFKLFVERVRTALNNIDDSNFPEGFNGANLKSRTVQTGALVGFEYEKVFFALAVPHTTTATTETTVGGLVQWNPSAWGNGNVKLILEVVGGIADVSATATFEIYGIDGVLASVTTQVASLSNLRSEAFSPPTEGQTIAFKMKTSNATYSAQATSARLIIVPS